MSASRPSSTVGAKGSDAWLSSSTAAAVSRRSRARDERVTGRCRQVKCRRQRAHGLDMGPSSFTAFERAHGVDRQPRNRRELLLRKPRRLAKGFELRGE